MKVRGEFVWRTHDDTDQRFLVIIGELKIQFRDGDVVLGPGQIFVVPRSCCRALSDFRGRGAGATHEPVGVVNTGAVGGALTATSDDSLA